MGCCKSAHRPPEAARPKAVAAGCAGAAERGASSSWQARERALPELPATEAPALKRRGDDVFEAAATEQGALGAHKRCRQEASSSPSLAAGAVTAPSVKQPPARGGGAAAVACADVALDLVADTDAPAVTSASTSPPLSCAAHSAPPASEPLGAGEVQSSRWFDGGSDDESAWNEFVERSAPSAGGEDASAPALFERFRTTASISEAYALFALLHAQARAQREADAAAAGQSCDAARSAPWSQSGASKLPYKSLRELLPGPFRAKRLWDLLDERSARAEYSSQPCSGKRVAVVGAGPSGLRAAIELRLLGASVVVLEKRSDFDRINRLHLWEWCGEDLKGLGARCLEPPPSDFGSDPDLIHIGIGELQTLLFKTALLFGVCVLFGTEFQDVACNEIDLFGWCVHLRSNQSSGVVCPGPRGPSACCAVDVIVGADGLQGRAKYNAGIKTIETGCVQAGGAIGLVVNFTNRASARERALRSFNFARQFKEQLFANLFERTGVDLENIVYTKGARSHYLVMTPSLRCLMNLGVVVDANAEPLLHRSNLNQDKLEQVAHAVAAFTFKEEQLALTDAIGEGNLSFCDGGPSLFDFSKMQRAEDGAMVLQPQEQGPPLLFFLVGDALLEPFWPEGLGIVRGFFSALEAVDHFAVAYGSLKSLTAKTRDQVLLDTRRGQRFAVDPSSRYRARSSMSLGRASSTDGRTSVRASSRTSVRSQAGSLLVPPPGAGRASSREPSGRAKSLVVPEPGAGRTLSTEPQFGRAKSLAVPDPGLGRTSSREPAPRAVSGLAVPEPSNTGRTSFREPRPRREASRSGRDDFREELDAALARRRASVT
eukprot:TRINITY_DN7138_c0_g1_i4.p1 TRINITY_DN7138_c0_g1~~TRINITY_DN7138_c0_g1_i4.p1  ORF type:complete len:831 (-),score=135.47 TRINITY_DN7138_c0_g1_i4:342-2834(-)